VGVVRGAILPSPIEFEAEVSPLQHWSHYRVAVWSFARDLANNQSYDAQNQNKQQIHQ